jgi:ABC-2 type transport system ATP-binding protein
MVQALRLEGVVRRYGANAVLDGVSLAVEPGESLALVGLNGAGKTTLIKGLLDFTHVDAGRIQVFGVDHRLPAARSRLAYLPERFLPPYFLTGGEFLRHITALHRAQASEEEMARAAAALDLAAEALARPVRTYSKGMAQKLGLAGCLLSGRDLLVLDEPMSGLDPRARALLRGELRSLKAAGRTLFFSTHLLADVEALCDRLAILHRGRVCFVGTPAQCCRCYGAADLEQAFLGALQG